MIERETEQTGNICLLRFLIYGKAFRVGGDAAKTVKVGKAVSEVTASAPIVIKITKEESGIMKLKEYDNGVRVGIK